MTTVAKKNILDNLNKKYPPQTSLQSEPMKYEYNQMSKKQQESSPIMPPPPPLIGADKFSQLVFDKIVEGMKMASETINPADIKLELDEIYSPDNENFVQENPSRPATPTISESDADRDELRQVETVSRVKPSAQHTDGFEKLLFDNILTAMKDASVSAQASLAAAQAAAQAEQTEVTKQLATTESAAQGLSKVIMDSIMKGFNAEPVSQGDSEVKEVTTKGSIYELFGEPVTPETLTYGIGIIDSKLDQPQPERVRYYFLYRQPATQSGIFGNKPQSEPFIFRVDMEQQSFKYINDVFVGKLKTNKIKEDSLTKKYIIPTTPTTSE
jgi:hypothetical protein